jgi:ATP-dependent Clp protease ATP-binding subunit ClpA
MARVIQEHVKRPLADELLFGQLVNGGRVSIEVRDGKLAARVEPAEEPVAVE